MFDKLKDNKYTSGIETYLLLDYICACICIICSFLLCFFLR